MRKLKIVITGGAGFIGSQLAKSYQRHGHQVFVIDNLINGRTQNLNSDIILFDCDITNSEELNRILDKIQPDIINHHAAIQIISNNNKDKELINNVNFRGTITILKAISKLKRPTKLIFASSGGALYNDNYTPPYSENNRLKLDTDYAKSKRQSEKYIEIFCKQNAIEYIIFRYSNVYGPSQSFSKNPGIILTLLQNAKESNPTYIHGDGEQTRDFIYIDDVIHANMLAITNSNSAVFNIATNTETSINSLIELISQIVTTKPIIKYSADRFSGKKRSCLDFQRAQTILGWLPKTSLTDGLITTFHAISL